MTGVKDAEMKVVVDCAGGTASLVLPSLLGRVGVGVLTVNNRLDDASPTETFAERRRDLQRLAELVASSRAAFGVRFDPVGERVSSSTRRASSSVRSGPFWWCSTWWPPNAGAGAWPCR